jgi:nucleoside-diphosphate-sugar epimerase
MRVFVTGGTGFIGSALIPELTRAGHEVLGLARSEAAAKALTLAGAKVHRGDLDDPSSLQSGVALADGVIHAGFQPGFSSFAAASEVERRAVEAFGAALAGSDRPLVITSGTAAIQPGRVATEDDATLFSSATVPRIATEEVATALAQRGVRASVVRVSLVHGEGDRGLHILPTLIGLAHEKGVSAYVGQGDNHWPAVHVLDIANLYRLALEKGAAGARYHGVAENGVTYREIAEVIAKRLGVPLVAKAPEAAAEHFGLYAMFAGMDGRVSSRLTQERLGWRPTHASLLEDLERGSYFKS